jgi:cellulose synthase/poly-beta-1,6-N-acetylglucosamine synthase-like glycosyltransferase
MNNPLRVLKLSFWFSITILVYTFVGYPVLIAVLGKWRRNPVKKSPIYPTLTLLIPAYNEESIIEGKIDNCLQLHYPKELLDIVIVADGSDDNTVALAERSQKATIYFEPKRKGKAAAINRVTPLLSTDIVVFTDANSMLNPEALFEIAANFADPRVGGVAGEKRVSGGGEGYYWRYESFLKQSDSNLSSVMGASGELFAIRREAFQPVEEDSIIEDFVLSMRLVGDGWRVIYEPCAIATESPTNSLQSDWQRRTRIAAGGLQSILRLPKMLDPRIGIESWQYFSHRVLRWLVTPLLLPVAFLLNAMLLGDKFYRLPFLAQFLFYAASLLGFMRTKRGKGPGVLNAFFYFVFANLAALVGSWRYIRGKQPVTWKKVR